MEMHELRLDLKDNEELKGHIKAIIDLMGENSNREGLLRTPLRVAKAMEEWYGGYCQKAEDVLNRTFSSEGYKGIIIVKDIDFYSHCEHHMTPFFGKAHIGYIAKKHITGLDKLVKIVEVFSRRLQNQERLTDQIADAIDKVSKPLGVIVVVEAQHF